MDESLSNSTGLINIGIISFLNFDMLKIIFVLLDARHVMQAVQSQSCNKGTKFFLFKNCSSAFKMMNHRSNSEYI